MSWLIHRNTPSGVWTSAAWIADQIHSRSGGPGRTLILGATFKENVPDLRNSKVFDVAARLRDLGHEVTIADPVADSGELEQSGFAIGELESADIVVGAVRHDDYAGLDAEDLSELVREGGLVADIKGMWRGLKLRGDIQRWSL